MICIEKLKSHCDIEFKMDKEKKNIIFQVVGVILLLAILYLMSVYALNSWLFGREGYDVITPSCKPECPEDKRCILYPYADGSKRGLYQAFTSESICV